MNIDNQDIFQNKISQYLIKANMDRIKTEYQNEWAILAVAIKYPEEHVVKLTSILNNDYNIQLNIAELTDKLKYHRLFFHSDRNSLLKQSCRVANDIGLLVNQGNLDAFDRIDEFFEKVYVVKGKNDLFAKAILVFTFLFDDSLKSQDGIFVIQKCGEVFCAKLIKEILVAIGKRIGKRRKRNIRQVFDESQEVFNVQSISGLEISSDKEKQIDALSFDLNNYRNALETVQAMFEDLKYDVESAAEEAKEVAVSEFFTKMNLSDYGNILDNLTNVENILKEMHRKKVELPHQLLPLTIVFSQLIKFIRDSKITSIDKMGRKFSTNFEGTQSFIYSGSEYFNEDEIKNVIVTAPGWKYGNTTISIPTIKELIEE